MFRYLRRRYREARGAMQCSGRVGVRSGSETARGRKMHFTPVSGRVRRRRRNIRKRNPERPRRNQFHSEQQAVHVADRSLVQCKLAGLPYGHTVLN